MASLGFLLICLAGQGPPQGDWAGDISVWDMSSNSTWIGSGQTYVEGLFAPGNMLVASAVVDASPDSVKIFTSQNSGATWSLRQFLVGSWEFVDPEMFVYDSGTRLALFVAGNRPDSLGLVFGVRYSLPSFDIVGYSGIPWNAPGCDTLRSIAAVVAQGSPATRWIFADDRSNRLYYATSIDGTTWTPFTLLDSNAARPRACAGVGGRVYVTFQSTASGNAIRCISMGGTGGTYNTTLYTGGGTNAAPCVAAELTGPQRVAIVYHNSEGTVVLSTSSNSGQTWSSLVPLGAGSYPSLDIAATTGTCLLGYVDQSTGRVMVAGAQSLTSLPFATPQVRGDLPAASGVPPVVRLSAFLQLQVLFYMGQGPRDVWFDSSVNTGMEDLQAPVGGACVTVTPNPSTGSFTASWAAPGQDAPVLRLYSVDGRVVAEPCTGSGQDGVVEFGQDLPAGVYILGWTGPGGGGSVRLVKLRP